MHGVHAVLTGADIGERYIGVTLSDWPVLAYERVRFVGEFVVAVAAETRALAEQAAAAVEVVYDVLPAMLDTEEAIAPGAPLMHADDSKFFFLHGPQRPARPHPNMQGYERVQKGDPAGALAAAPHVFEKTFHTPRYHAGYLEPRAALVWIDDDDVTHVMSPNKNPFFCAIHVCPGDRITEGKIRHRAVLHRRRVRRRALTIRKSSALLSCPGDEPGR